MALAHPTLHQEAREAIACDYFIDAMDDADFALKISERAPPTLDEALRVARLQLEAWMEDATQPGFYPDVPSSLHCFILPIYCRFWPPCLCVPGTVPSMMSFF